MHVALNANPLFLEKPVLLSPPAMSIDALLDQISEKYPTTQDDSGRVNSLHGHPVMVVVNNKPVMRAEWSIERADTDRIIVQTLVQGGDGSDPLRTALLIVVAAVAFATGNAIAGSAALKVAIGGTAASVIGGIASAGVTIAGNALINKIAPIPVANVGPAASPTYSANVNGNLANLGGAIPEVIGTFTYYPPLAAAPFYEYVNNEQWINQLFCIGEESAGSINHITDIYLGDTRLAYHDPDYFDNLPAADPVDPQTWGWPNGFNFGDNWFDDAGFTANYPQATEAADPYNSDLRIDNGFEDVQFQIIRGGEDIKLFPLNVYTSPSVANIQADTDPFANITSYDSNTRTLTLPAPHGLHTDTNTHFVVLERGGDINQPIGCTVGSATTLILDQNPPNHYQSSNATYSVGTNFLGEFSCQPIGVNAIGLSVDIAFPAGLSNHQKDGDQVTGYQNIVVEYRKIGTTNWTARLFKEQNRTYDVIRKTYNLLPPDPDNAGEYEARLKILNPVKWEGRENNLLVWASMRSVLEQSETCPGVTLLAVKMRASEQLSQYTQGKFKVTTERQIPTWNGTSWTSPIATSNPADWMAHAVQVATGGRDALVLPELNTLRNTLASRGDTCNGVMDQRVSLKEALRNIGTTCRTTTTYYGGIIRFHRDERQTQLGQGFTGRNMLPGTFNASYIAPDENYPDGVEFEYYNVATGQPEHVTVKIGGGIPNNPKRLSSLLINDRNQAGREGLFHAAQLERRRGEVSFQTLGEGFLSDFGSKVPYAHPKWDTYGDVVSISGTTVELSEPFIPGSDGRIGLRRPNGTIWTDGITPGSNANEVILDNAPDFPVQTDLSMERTHFLAGDTELRYGLLVGAKPVDALKVSIALIIDDDEVHDADNQAIAPAPDVIHPQISAPLLQNLRITQSGTFENPYVSASWEVLEGFADHFILQVNYGAGAWQTIASNLNSTSWSGPLAQGEATFRVAGVNDSQGPWITSSVQTVGEPDRINDIIELFPLTAWKGSRAKIRWQPIKFASNYRVRVYKDAGTTLVKEVVIDQPSFDYGEDDMLEDIGGTFRDAEIHVKGLTRGGTESAEWETIQLENPQCVAATSIALAPSYQTITFKTAEPPEEDYAGTLVWLSTTQGFTPSGSTLAYRDNSWHGTLARLTNGSNLSPGTTYYFRVAHYDKFGEDSLAISAEQSVTTKRVQATSEVDGLGAWATRTTPADATFIENNLQVDSIPSTRIQSIVAGKIAAGTISALLTISGLIRTAASGWRVEVGPHNDVNATDVNMLSHTDGTDQTLALRDNGDFILGDEAAEKTLTWDAANAQLRIGRNAELVGGYMLNNESYYWHFNGNEPLNSFDLDEAAAGSIYTTGGGLFVRGDTSAPGVYSEVIRPIGKTRESISSYDRVTSAICSLKHYTAAQKSAFGFGNPDVGVSYGAFFEFETSGSLGNTSINARIEDVGSTVVSLGANSYSTHVFEIRYFPTTNEIEFWIKNYNSGVETLLHTETGISAGFAGSVDSSNCTIISNATGDSGAPLNTPSGITVFDIRTAYYNG